MSRVCCYDTRYTNRKQKNQGSIKLAKVKADKKYPSFFKLCQFLS